MLCQLDVAVNANCQVIRYARIIVTKNLDELDTSFRSGYALTVVLAEDYCQRLN
jgi:hypothetical protein